MASLLSSTRPFSFVLLISVVSCGGEGGHSSDGAAHQQSGGTGASTSSGGTNTGGGTFSGGTGSGAAASGGAGSGGAVVVVDPTGPFTVAKMAIDVAGGAAVTSKDTYVGCSITLDGNGS